MSDPGDAGRAVSEPAPEPPPVPVRVRFADKVAFVLVPTGLAMALAALVAFEPPPPDMDLRVVVAGTATPGRTMGVHALVLTALSEPRGPALSTPPVEVRLVDASGVERGRASLAPTPFDTLVGTLPVAERTGPLRLEASTPEARVEGVVDVADRVVAAPTRGRLASPLAQLRLGPRPSASGVAPDRLDVRVTGGACVPGIVCEVWVHVGRPAARVELEGRDAVSVAAGPAPSQPTAGLVRFEVVVSGPEAPLDLVATRDGVRVATRRVRLPLALGAPTASLGPSLAYAPATPRLELAGLDGRAGAVVDVFRGGAWERAGTAAAPDDGGALETELPGGALDAGLWRVQAQVDRFELELTAVRSLWVAERGASPAAALAGLVSRLRATGVDDRFLDDLRARPPAELGSPEAVASYLLAARDAEIALPPDPVGSRAAALVDVNARRTRFQRLTAGLFVLAGLWVAAYVARRGLIASAEARALLTAAGDPGAGDPGHRWRDRLTVLGVVAAVALAFVAGVMIVLALGPVR